MSLANALAVARAGRGLVLFGDPAQLEQPQKGVHSAGRRGLDARALAWRRRADDSGKLGRLSAQDAPASSQDLRLYFQDLLRRTTQRRADARPRKGSSVSLPGELSGAGVRFLAGRAPRQHQSSRPKKSQSCAAAGRAHMLAESATFQPRDGALRRLTVEDVLVVAPYNVQVGALAARTPRRRAGRHRRQIPRPRSPDRHLLDDQLERRRRAAWHGVSVQPEPPQRRRFARPSAVHRGGEPGACARFLQNSAANQARQRAVCVPRSCALSSAASSSLLAARLGGAAEAVALQQRLAVARQRRALRTRARLRHFFRGDRRPASARSARAARDRSASRLPPSFLATNDNATIATSALPVSANCKAWRTFSACTILLSYCRPQTGARQRFLRGFAVRRVLRIRDRDVLDVRVLQISQRVQLDAAFFAPNHDVPAARTTPCCRRRTRLLSRPRRRTKLLAAANKSNGAPSLNCLASAP